MRCKTIKLIKLLEVILTSALLFLLVAVSWSTRQTEWSEFMTVRKYWPVVRKVNQSLFRSCRTWSTSEQYC